MLGVTETPCARQRTSDVSHVDHPIYDHCDYRGRALTKLGAYALTDQGALFTFPGLVPIRVSPLRAKD